VIASLAIDFKAIDRPRFEVGATVKPPQTDDGKGDHAQHKAGRSFLAATQRRRMAGIKRAAELLEHLPGDGETLHCVLLGYFDLASMLLAFLDRIGTTCDVLRIATLSASKRNVAELAALIDAGAVRRVDLLTSEFQRKYDPDIFEEAIAELAVKRGQRVAAARTHAKLITLAMADGRRYVFEGSANLRTSRNAEQVALSCGADLHRFYDAWIDEVMTAHEGRQSHDQETG
jgi:hypothetical protein